MKRLILAVVLGVSALAAFALPTVEDVQAEVAKGNYTQAEQMMRSVVEAKPGSARAHYVYAEILAHDRHYERAAEQAARAKAIDPTLQFTQPEQFKAFEELLARQRAPAARQAAAGVKEPAPAVQLPVAAPGSGGVPGWVWGLGLVAAAVVAWRAFSGRRQPANAGFVTAPPQGMGARGMEAGAAGSGVPMAGAASGAGYGSSYPQVPPVAGRNWLGTGIAAAGGVAAGMMAERLLNSHHDNGQGLAPSADAPAGLRGMAPGLLGGGPADADVQHDLDQRPIDFGSGDGWGADAGPVDGGSESSDDGW